MQISVKENEKKREVNFAIPEVHINKNLLPNGKQSLNW